MSLRLAAALCAALVALAGCADDPKQPGKVPSEAAPSPSSSSPSSTRQTIEEQVEAFVREYLTELELAAQTNETDRLKTMVTRTCPCYRAVRVINRYKQRGESAPEARVRLKSIRVHDVLGRSAQVEARYDISRYDVIDRQGKVITTIPRRPYHVDLSVIESPDGWLISNVVDLRGA